MRMNVKHYENKIEILQGKRCGEKSHSITIMHHNEEVQELFEVKLQPSF